MIADDGTELRSTSLVVPSPSVVRLRYVVRVPYQRRTALSRRALFARDDHRCQYCGTCSDPLSVDHVVPRSRGGLDTWENVTTACLRCNVHKGNRTPREAGMVLLHQPRRPLSGPLFEAQRQMASGRHHEWAKYVQGWDDNGLAAA